MRTLPLAILCFVHMKFDIEKIAIRVKRDESFLALPLLLKEKKKKTKKKLRLERRLTNVNLLANKYYIILLDTARMSCHRRKT